MLLNDEPDTADLREKVSRAWQEFAHSLAEVLPTLPDGAHLEITLDPTASGTGEASYSVAVIADDGLAAYAVGNGSLPPAYHMNRATIADMVALGWSPPGVEPESGDRFGISAGRDRAARLATVVCRTLRDIYGAPHPAFLVYWVAGEDGARLPVDPLGTARTVAGPLPGSDGVGVEDGPGIEVAADGTTSATGADGPMAEATGLREHVRAVIATMQQTTPDELTDDPDGDIGIRAGSAMVFVKVRDDPPLVDVLSPVLTEVEPSERLYGRLSELTNRMPVGRLYCTHETVWASVPVFGRCFQSTHLVLAVQVMTGLADELDDRLQREFGGRRFFAELEDGHRRVDDRVASTGMYL